MTIQYKLFIVPFYDIQDSESELNRFLRSVKVIHIDQEFVSNGHNSFWRFTIEYTAIPGKSSTSKSTGSGKKRIDYREVLSPEDFVLYTRLREWRNGEAAEEGQAPYHIFTNEQIAEMAKARMTTKTEMGKIKGIGESRVEKYAASVLNIIKDETEKQKKKKDTEKTGKDSGDQVKQETYTDEHGQMIFGTKPE